MTGESAYEELLLEEEELIDDYLAGTLSAHERSRFEQHFLCTEERRGQLRFAQTLGRYVSAKTGDEPVEEKVEELDVERGQARASAVPSWGERLSSFWGGQGWAARAALALGVAVVVLGALWLVVKPGTPRTFATLTLAASAGDRAEGVHAEKVGLPLAADALRINLTLPAGTPPAARYRVELLRRGSQAEEIETEGRNERSVSVVVPASHLARGQYALRLFAVAPDGTERRIEGNYFFNAE